jgi:alpha-tubulin suppressor-like RCC1 family protein
MPNFSGKWGLTEQLQAVAAGTWTGLPLPQLYAWGDNALGQLGEGGVSNKSSPIQIGTQIWSAVSAGRNNTTAVKTDGTMWSWGDNTAGNLGIEPAGLTSSRSSPVQVGALTDWLLPAAGGYSSFAINTSGRLYGWGANEYGSVGDSTNTARSSPVQIGALTNWSKVSAGRSRNGVAIKTDGTMWSWGRNLYGAVGSLAIGASVNSPVQLGALTTWAEVVCGYYGSTAIKTDGTLWAWGRNANGQLGDNTTVDKSSPVQLGAQTDWAKVARQRFTVAVKTTGTLWAWGSNFGGALGLGDDVARSSPVQIGALTNWSTPSGTRGFNNCATKTDGTLWSWGFNNNGQLGDGTTTSRSSPVQVGALTNWAHVSAGLSHVVSIYQGSTN